MFSCYVLSKQDLLAIVHLVCCVFGIGSLAMPYILAQAGPTYSAVAFILSCFFNTYATVALSRCFLKLRHLPHIHTYTDLAVHMWGSKGRLVVQATQLTTCFLLPVAFLVLGGATLLPAIFDGAINLPSTVWIILMAVALLPIIYIRVLHEAYIVLISGAAATFIADVIATVDAYVAHGNELFEPTDNVSFTNVLDTFGSFALSYGAALIVPQLHHHHPQPERLPTALAYGMLLISAFYVTLGALGYAQFGCASPNNLLLAMSHSTHRRRVAYASMFLHVAIAFAVLLNPFLVTVEKSLFPQNAALDKCDDDVETEGDGDMVAAADFNELETPMKAAVVKTAEPLDAPKNDATVASLVALNDTVDAREPQPPAKFSDTTRRILFRTVVVAIQCFLAMLLQRSFFDMADLMGASLTNMCSVILPLLLYYKLFKADMSTAHKIVCWTVIVVSIMLGSYSTIQAIIRIVKNASEYTLFSSVTSSKRTSYPFCPVGYTDRKAPFLDSFE
ncbi:hypothetical protein H310_11429 [Aphanomyces invadans]|uniref:Amino acid transporter transmembrane domain-containing protein n=1 Tax=Aphanomyces invadans TaxID=157072 RepID=A0A024TLY1_9STRA|nr:hypothetical protein H310_11429 [Aphanomyces invadans]ETV95165.1 hypothetical protein H310_11429 [Aphanomyces invadans]|eukprot:XP_008876338.1 hypothetical protein H310_11429 [Aphanomyces invadans]